MVFVLDKHKKPLMPCTPKRARLLLARGRAVVHRVKPFVIRLKDRTFLESAVQPISLKVDPGSHITGMALARVEKMEEGDIHHAVFLSEVQHRGEDVHKAKQTQASRRRRRRSTNLRHRAPRFLNRRQPVGWLPPSLLSRLGNVLTWTDRVLRWCPIIRIEVERVRFDMQLLQNPEITGTAYQRGELAGWEVRAYLLVKFGYRCAYCGKANVPFEVDHLRPKSRGGSDRVSNLALSCHVCNQSKGNKTAIEFGHPEVERQAKAPMIDAAAVNATRYALVEMLGQFGLPIGTWSGGRTRWNRARFHIEKTHALDALCVGNLAGVHAGRLHTCTIKAMGRGQHCRTNWDKHGFPRGYFMRQKMVHGIKTGDYVQARVPAGFVAVGTHRGRIAVRKTGNFRMGTIQGIPARFCQVVQRADGYEYVGAYRRAGEAPSASPLPQPEMPASSP